MSEHVKVSNSLVDTSSGGAFQRKSSSFRNTITADGSNGFKAEPNRYHLYVSLACPWAHRTMLFRKLKGLEDVIGLSVVHYYMGEYGWSFKKEHKGDVDDATTGDSVHNFDFLRQVYMKSDPDYNGRITVPVLWDKHKNVIVNNESSEIIRILNKEFNAFAKNPSLDLCPEELRADIDKMNEYVYPNINNGVYRCGFATSQQAYEEAFRDLFTALDKIEDVLSKSRFLTGDKFTEADVRLFTTLIRFDVVYVGHFKCNKKQIRQYPAIYNYLKELYQHPSIKPTVNFKHIKNHYYMSHPSINPTGVVPVGPDPSDLDSPHNRSSFGGVSEFA
eukprot:TRINITY_DN9816_c0_g1_i1.p1 TRINITY_DN9816_c0_g1~~TRINITY_DN9816_c0_g1_i1.p1  ORF type:complete len:332 (-),score=92.87 TRINITY_DN9816_c0_g1_i1:31-1026(-)